MPAAARYRLGEMAWEEEPATGDLYVAGLPHGPISRVIGAGALVLGALDKAAAPLTLAQIMESLRAALDGIPEDADRDVEQFLQTMIEIGVITRESPRPGEEAR